MFISARDYLSKFGISMEEALSFVAGNISQPQIIHQVFKGGGLTTRMLTEIVQQAIPEISNDVVKAYFAGAGLDHVELDLPDFAAIKASSAIAHLTAINDNFTGSEGTDIIDAGLGDDTIDGKGGNDYLFGGSGNDTIYGGAGADHIEGGGGNDTLYGFYYSDTGDDRSPNVIFGDAGADKIYGGNGDDRLYGGDGADTLRDDITGGLQEGGEFGNDWLDGGSGDDQLFAGSGFDTLLGGEGNDLISAGGIYGFNIIDGGAGNDVISFAQGDQVNAGSGDDNITYDGLSSLARLQLDIAHAGHSVVVAGEGADTLSFGSGIFNALSSASKVTVDLREALSSVDVVEIYAFHSKPVSPVLELIGFEINSDKINLARFDLFGTEDSKDGVKGYAGVNFAQILSNPNENYRLATTSSKKTEDDYGKGFFVIQGASAAADTASVAQLIDAYGNDATYGKSYEHYFLVNIAQEDSALYLFTDDTGADNQVIADELTPMALLRGIRTEDFSAAELAYTFI
jgi:hypothetical protein